MKSKDELLEMFKTTVIGEKSLDTVCGGQHCYTQGYTCDTDGCSYSWSDHNGRTTSHTEDD